MSLYSELIENTVSGFRAPRLPLKLRLNQKYTLVVFVVALVPVVFLAAVLFGNMQSVVISERISEIERNILQIQTQAEKTAELCNMTSQFFINNSKLNEFLLRAALDDPFTMEELIAFYRDDVSGFERFVNANPYLYQVRIYYDNIGIPEIMPVLYHTSRMDRLTWAETDWVSGSWQFDYQDTIFPPEVMKPVQNIMALIFRIDDYRNGRLGVLEVAVRMNELFPDLFSEHEDYLSGFIVGENLFFPPGENWFWNTHRQSVLSLIGESASAGVTTLEAAPGGKAAFVLSVPLKQFNGHYITVVFRDSITANLAVRRNIFLAIAVISIVLLAFAVNLLVKAMLRRFYRVVRAVQEVRGGNLLIEMPNVGDDEIGMLGEQINQMMDRIRKLMNENVRRERLAKNSQIRALQSQINTHFIYNVLESIKMMAEVDSLYEISDAITSLGKMLRYSMHWKTDTVTLKNEIEHLQNYIDLINFRYDYNVVIQLNLPPRLYNQNVPKLIIQPIVENAVVHGIEEIAENTTIEIGAMEYEQYFTLEITDHGKGIAPARLKMINDSLASVGAELGISEESDADEPGGDGGIGLKNVHDRITTMFGPEYGISITSEEGRRTCVTISIPYT